MIHTHALISPRLDAEIGYVFGAICLYIIGLAVAVFVLEKLGKMIKEELALYHPKDIKRQERQNAYYDTLS